GCRIDRTPLATRPRHTASHQVGELRRRLQWGAPPRLDTLAGDAAAVTLFAVVPEPIRQFTLAQPLNQGAGRFSLARIEPHIERAVLLKAEAALRTINLIGANAQVRQNSV